jgi:glutamate 5-kinase
MILDLKDKKRLVIKIGSSLLIKDGELRQDWVERFAADVVDLGRDGFEVVIITSGTVAFGKKNLKLQHSELSLEERQAASAIGQIKLMSFYRSFFKKLGIEVAQILLTASDCNSRTRYLNCKNTIETLLQNKVIPIINENDSVSIDEMQVGDNDRLAARVAQMSSADLMILFSDINGLYDSNPKINANAKFINEVLEITPEIEGMAGGSASEVGTGGMITKIMAAKMLEASDCDVLITDGFAVGSLKELIRGDKTFTIFRGNNYSNNQRQDWLSGFLNINNGVIINKCAVDVLKNKRVSLLPVGIVGIIGEFQAGDAIVICDEAGAQIATGVSNHSSVDVEKVLKMRSEQAEEVLGGSVRAEVVSIDNLMVI